MAEILQSVADIHDDHVSGSPLLPNRTFRTQTILGTTTSARYSRGAEGCIASFLLV